MKRSSVSHFFVLLAVLGVVLGFAGCATPHPERSQFSIELHNGAGFDNGKLGYDREIGGFWLFGRNSGVLVTPLPLVGDAAGAGAQPAPLVLNVRTVPVRSAPSVIAMLLIATPSQFITARPGESSITVVPNSETTDAGGTPSAGKPPAPARMEILTNNGDIAFERDDNRIRVVISGAFLRRHAPAGAYVKWFDR
jgi:hypothetical protein